MGLLCTVKNYILTSASFARDSMLRRVRYAFALVCLSLVDQSKTVEVSMEQFNPVTLQYSPISIVFAR